MSSSDKELHRVDHHHGQRQLSWSAVSNDSNSEQQTTSSTATGATSARSGENDTNQPAMVSVAAIGNNSQHNTGSSEGTQIFSVETNGDGHQGHQQPAGTTTAVSNQTTSNTSHKAFEEVANDSENSRLFSIDYSAFEDTGSQIVHASSSSPQPAVPAVTSSSNLNGTSATKFKVSHSSKPAHSSSPTHGGKGVKMMSDLEPSSGGSDAVTATRVAPPTTYSNSGSGAGVDAFGSIHSEGSSGGEDNNTSMIQTKVVTARSSSGKSLNGTPGNPFASFAKPTHGSSSSNAFTIDTKSTERHILEALADLLHEADVDVRDVDQVKAWATDHHESVGKKVCELFTKEPTILSQSMVRDPLTNTYKIMVDTVTPSSPAVGFSDQFAVGKSTERKKRAVGVSFGESVEDNVNTGSPPAFQASMSRKKSVFACNTFDAPPLVSQGPAGGMKRNTNSRKSIAVGLIGGRSSAASRMSAILGGSHQRHHNRQSDTWSFGNLNSSSTSMENDDRHGPSSLSPPPLPGGIASRKSMGTFSLFSGTESPAKHRLLSVHPGMDGSNPLDPNSGHSSDDSNDDSDDDHHKQSAGRSSDPSSMNNTLTTDDAFTLPSWSDRKQYATDDQAEENAEQARKTNFKSYHMLIVLAIMVFNFFVIPIRVGVGSDQFPSWFWALEVVIDVAAVVAAVMRLWLPVEDRGRVILDRAKIKEAYFQTQLKLDIFALFPLQLLLLPLAHAGVVSSVARDFARINRLLYLPAFSALFDDVAERWLAVLHPLVHRLMKFLFAFFAYVFITAAPMMMAFRQDVALGRQWMAIQNNDDGVDYGVVLFYAFGISAGRSFPNPNTETQMIVMLVISFFGMGSMAVIISGVTSLILSLVERSSKLLNKLQDASGQLKHMRMSDEITGEVLEYYELMFKQFNTFDYSNSEDMFDEIPFDLLQYLEDHINTDIIKSVTLFENVTDPKMIRAIASGLEMYVVMPGTVICREGDEGYDMYFMAKGAAVATFKHFPELNSELQEGDYFGQASLLYADVQHLTVVTKTVSQLFALGKEHFDRIVEAYPELLEPIVKSATELHERRAELMKQHEHNSNNASSASLAVPQLGESGNKHDAELRSSTHSDTGSSGQRESSSRRTLLESSVKSMSWKNSKSGRSMGSSSTTRNGRRLRGAAGVSNLQEAELLSQSLSSFVGQHRRDRGEKSSGNTKGRRLSLSKDTYSNSMSGSDRGFVVTVVKEQSPEAPMRGAGALGGQRNPLMGAPSRSSSPSLDSHHSDTLGPNQRTPRHSNTRDYSSGGKDDQKEFSLESANRSSSTITDDRRGTHVIKMQGDTKDDGFDNPFL